MKKIMLALAAVACLSVPALADEDGRGIAVERAEPAAPVVHEVEPVAAPAIVQVGHDGCDHHGGFGHGRYSQHEDFGPGFRGRRFYDR